MNRPPGCYPGDPSLSLGWGTLPLVYDYGISGKATTIKVLLFVEVFLN